MINIVFCFVNLHARDILLLAGIDMIYAFFLMIIIGKEKYKIEPLRSFIVKGKFLVQH